MSLVDAVRESVQVVVEQSRVHVEGHRRARVPSIRWTACTLAPELIASEAVDPVRSVLQQLTPGIALNSLYAVALPTESAAGQDQLIERARVLGPGRAQGQ